MPSRRAWILGGLVTVLLLVAIGWTLAARAVRAELLEETARWGQAAAGDARPDFTYADARDWLLDAGFDVVTFPDAATPAPFVGVKYLPRGHARLTVTGGRKVREEGLVGPEAWVDVSFVFSPDGRLVPPRDIVGPIAARFRTWPWPEERLLRDE